jgi:proline iminopeptidase
LNTLKVVLAALAYSGYALLSYVIAVGAAIWASPRNHFEYFFILALIALYLLLYAGILRFIRSSRTGRFRAVKRIAGLAVFGLMSAAMLIPGNRDRQDAAAPETLQYWSLPTGSVLSYIHIEADASAGGRKSTPVLFLHGGPGIPDLPGDSRYFGRLAQDGYDVYVYAQAGSGYSARLEDPTQYGVERDARDLEEIRKRIGADKLILIGHSYGSEVIARYMVDNGEHVARAAFLSPGAMDPLDHSDADLTDRLDSKQKWRLYRHLLHPRSLFVYGLLQVHPDVARSFASDGEMDRRFEAVYAATEPALHCPGYQGHSGLGGLGFYANQTPQSMASESSFDPRPSLSEKNFTLPVLIAKGGCDYLSWESAEDYHRVFPNSKLVYLSDAGHNLYQDKPDVVMDILREFLENGTGRLQGYEGRVPPDDFQGSVRKET